MKSLSFSLALLMTAHHLVAMNQDAAPVASQNQAAPDEVLTSDEARCFTWFHESVKKDGSYFKQLSQEDRDVITRGLTLKDYPVEVRRSRTNAARAFLGQLQSKGIKAEFSEEQLIAALVKVTKRPKSSTDSK